MSLATLIEAAPIENDVRVVWDSRDREGGTRLEVSPAPLDGFRAILQDRAGICMIVWRPDSTELDVVTSCLDSYLDILNH